MTLFTALTSLITGKAVDPKIAMTGEIMLSGAVLPVGRIKREGFGLSLIHISEPGSNLLFRILLLRVRKVPKG